MKFYMAPMEGITGYVYRNAYNRYFHDMDRYYIPFVDARMSGKFGNKENNDLSPDNNKGMKAIPQILTNNAESFINTAKAISQLGYDEININLGCPSGTVVSKGKGSGALADLERLEALLEGIFSGIDVKLSIKTRLGMSNPEDIYRIIELYNKYELTELIVHPRVREEFYKGKPHWDVYKNITSMSKNKLCYNGDIFSVKDYEMICEMFPDTERVMLGRGVLTNPGLVGNIKGTGLLKDTLEEFHQDLYESYKKVIPGSKNVLFKVKELWSYMCKSFTDYEDYYKAIVKSKDTTDYELAVKKLFREQDLIESIK